MNGTDSTPDRQLRRRARTRAALVDAARAVFAERGVEGATIQEITDTADVAKGSFYNHFESRDDILRSVVETTLDRLGNTLDRSLAATEKDPARLLACSLYATIRACVEDPVVGGFVLNSAGTVDVAESTLGQRGRRDLRAGIRNGRFQVADVELLITTVAGAAEAVIRKRLRNELPAKAEVGLVSLVLQSLGVTTDEARILADEAARMYEEGRRQ